MFPAELTAAIDAVVPAGVTHIGFVPGDVYGRFLLSEPHSLPEGISATFSKVKLDSNETPSRALARCLHEQVGKQANSVYPIRQVWVTPNSTGYYFAGLIYEEPEAVKSSTAVLRWCEADEVRRRLGSSPSPVQQKRDMALFGYVEKMCLSPSRNVLLMLQELHRRGFERLRAYCYVYALGTWRCEITPASWLTNAPRMTPECHPLEFRERLHDLLGLQNFIYFYTSASEQHVFGSDDAVFLSPRELADRYIRAFPAIAAAGYGPDREYVTWYDNVLDLLAPNGIFYAFAEFNDPEDYLYTWMARAQSVPLPPPGKLDAAEWARFAARFSADEK